MISLDTFIARFRLSLLFYCEVGLLSSAVVHLSYRTWISDIAIPSGIRGRLNLGRFLVGFAVYSSFSHWRWITSTVHMALLNSNPSMVRILTAENHSIGTWAISWMKFAIGLYRGSLFSGKTFKLYKSRERKLLGRRSIYKSRRKKYKVWSGNMKK
jgi:hypothetical protein